MGISTTTKRSIGLWGKKTRKGFGFSSGPSTGTSPESYATTISSKASGKKGEGGWKRIFFTALFFIRSKGDYNKQGIGTEAAVSTPPKPKNLQDPSTPSYCSLLGMLTSLGLEKVTTCS